MTTTVLGAGYAGVMAANRLAGRGETVVLITPFPWFVERIRLHAVAAGVRRDARRELRTLLHPGVTLVQDTAVRIGEEEVIGESGTRYPYRNLVYAAGSGAPSDSTLHTIASESGALRLRAALGARPGAPVRVIGAGLTGIEAAGALVAAGREVRLIAAGMPERRAARAMLRNLTRRGVEVLVGQVPLRDVAGEITVDSTGFSVPPLAARSALPTDSHGRLRVDRTLRVPGHPRIFGVGDAVRIDHPSASHLRPSCATALPMGAHAADAIISERRGEPHAPFRAGYVLQCVDLGRDPAPGRRRFGHVQFVHPDDRERPFALTGPAGALLKEVVCRMTIRWMSNESRRPGQFSWPEGPAVGVSEEARG